MNMKESPGPSRPGRVSGKDMADALADVLQEQSEKARRREEQGPRRKRSASSGKWVALVSLSIFSGYLWIGSPSWLQPAPPEPISPALVDAGIRMEIFDQALLVEDFRDREGRLPNSLSEAGDPFSEVDYVRGDGQTYRFTAAGTSGTVEYSSTDSLELFLGDAPRVIRGGG